jgi:hypothetical protein
MKKKVIVLIVVAVVALMLGFILSLYGLRGL